MAPPIPPPLIFRHFDPVIDTTGLVEDIKAGLLVDPIAKRELDLCLSAFVAICVQGELLTLLQWW